MEKSQRTKTRSFKESLKNRNKGKKYSSKELKEKEAKAGKKKETKAKPVRTVIGGKETRRIFQKIKKWRKKNDQAPVDLGGAHKHFDPKHSKNERAFQHMVGVLLSVQSRDEITDRVSNILIRR